MYNIPDKTDPTYQHKIEKLLWYVDIYLPATAGLGICGKVDRSYKTMGEAVELPNKTRVPMVPVEAEAFGWLMLENCQEKWKLIVPMKAKNPRWSIPQFSKDDSSTHQYHNTKWTDPKTGKDQGGGWDTSAYPVFSSYIQTIQKIREDDKKNGFPVQKMCLAMIREKHGITAEERPKKRRRRGDKKPKLAPAQEMNFVLQVKDEFDDTAVDVKVGVVDGTERGNL